MPTIRTGDFDTHYDDEGTGPPVVLVHASTLDRTSWRHQVAALKATHRVIAYDLRGHGRSGPPKPGKYSASTLADDLHTLVQALGLDRPVVCGLSMGGMAAMTFAARYPDALSALVLAGAPTPPLLSFSERLQRAVLPRTMTGMARLVGYERLKKVLIRAQARVHGDDAVGGFTAADLPPMTTRAFARSVRCFARFHKVRVDLTAIKVPTLVLYGAKEPPFVARHAARLKEQVPDVEVAPIAGAGHASNLDRPEAFNEALRGFLARRPASARAVGAAHPTAKNL